MRDVTHWPKALRILSGFGLGIEPVGDSGYSMFYKKDGSKGTYTLSVNLDDFMDWFVNNREAWDNAVLIAQQKLSTKK